MVVQIDCLFVNTQGKLIISSPHETDTETNLYQSRSVSDKGGNRRAFLKPYIK